MAIFGESRFRPHRKQTFLTVFPLSKEALEYVQNRFTPNEQEIVQARNFVITGGTGFAGRWLLTVLNALVSIPRESQIEVITRDPTKRTNYPNHINFIHWSEEVQQGKARTINSEVVCFHAGVPAASGEIINVPSEREFSARLSVLIENLFKVVQSPIVINLSSGGVYKRPKYSAISEEEEPVEEDQSDAYRRVKYADELVISRYVLNNALRGANPRLFSFTGPGLVIPGNYALSNFIGQALNGQAVEILGNPYSRRSYMSPLDMAIWLIKCSLYPTLETLHIGSDDWYSMEEIAAIISKRFGNGRVAVLNKEKFEPESYVPEITKTMSRINVDKPMRFEDSLKYWLNSLEF